MSPNNLLLVSEDPILVDPFSKKGALVLFWLLGSRKYVGGENGSFSINQAARELGVGPFTVHRVIRTLEYDGIIRSSGLGTKKRFYLANPKALLIKWLRHYHVQRKSKFHRFAISDPKTFKLRSDEYINSILVPALHTASRLIFHAGVTNLSATEGYLLEIKKIGSITQKLSLTQQDRGYEVLLIEPYYLGVAKRYHLDRDDPTWKNAFALLTFLDLYHFPIRGREQAEALYRKVSALKFIGPWSEIEAIEVG